MATMKKTMAIALLGGVALGAASCSFGPIWQKPQMAVPAVFRGKSFHEGNMADLPWQVVLKDAKLTSLLTDAFNANRSIVALQHNVQAARQYVTIARAPLFPWLGYSASTSKGMNQQGGAAIAQTGGITTNPGASALSASWELDLWGKTSKGVESAMASAQAAQEELNNLRVSLLRQVACGYLQLMMLDEQLRIAHESVESYRESLHLFQNQLEANSQCTGGIICRRGGNTGAANADIRTGEYAQCAGGTHAGSHRPQRKSASIRRGEQGGCRYTGGCAGTPPRHSSQGAAATCCKCRDRIGHSQLFPLHQLDGRRWIFLR